MGLSSIIGKRKNVVFGFVKDCIWNRINHRMSKHLSKVGKEILVKSVAQSIPTFCMSVYFLPSTLEDELRRVELFLVGFKQSTKKKHYLAQLG